MSSTHNPLPKTSPDTDPWTFEHFYYVSKTQVIQPTLVEPRRIDLGSSDDLHYRIRCLRFDDSMQFIATPWPPNIEVLLDGKVLPIPRRKLSEFQAFLVLHLSRITTLELRETGPRGMGQHKSYLDVEVVQTQSHSQIMDYVRSYGIFERENTIEKIKTRLADEDSSKLHIDLADRFGGTIFNIPARGLTCEHFECFDLETYLLTRATIPVCARHSVVSCACHQAVLEIRTWQCPICGANASPLALRIDKFLQEVREQLEGQGTLEFRKLLVDADGVWEPVMPDDDGGQNGKAPMASGHEVIELD